MRVKLHILSDLHLELQTAPFRPSTAAKADVIVLTGDIGNPQLMVEI